MILLIFYGIKSLITNKVDKEFSRFLFFFLILSDSLFEAEMLVNIQRANIKEVCYTGKSNKVIKTFA